MWCHKPFWAHLPHSAPCLQGVRRHLWSRTNLSSPEDLSVPRVVNNPLCRIFYCVCSTVDPIFFLAELQQGVIPSGAGFGWVGVGEGGGALCLCFVTCLECPSQLFGTGEVCGKWVLGVNVSVGMQVSISQLCSVKAGLFSFHNPNAIVCAINSSLWPFQPSLGESRKIRLLEAIFTQRSLEFAPASFHRSKSVTC